MAIIYIEKSRFSLNLKFIMPGVCALCCSVVLFASGFALASGSHSAFYQSESDRYALGKKIYQEKMVCVSCKYPGLTMDEDGVGLIYPDIHRSGEMGASLGVVKRRSLQHYLNRRFDLNLDLEKAL